MFTIASGQNKKSNPAMVNTTLKEANKSNSALMDSTQKIPKGYSKRKLIKTDLICGTNDYTSIPDAESEANSSFVTDGKNIYHGIYKLDEPFDITTFGTLSDHYCYDKNGIYDGRYDSKLDKSIYEKLPFKYTDDVSKANAIEYRYVFYKNRLTKQSNRNLKINPI